MTEEEFRSGVLEDGTRLMQPPVSERKSIAAMIEAEGAKRGRHMARAGRILADAIRAGFDLPDEAAPEGVRARYGDGGVA